MTEKKLTDKEEAFCQAYVGDAETRWNKLQSAIKAGYSEHSAKVIGYENLTKPHIKKRVAELAKASLESNEALTARVLEEIKKIAFSDIGDYINDDLSAKNINEVDTKAIKKIIKEQFGENGIKVKYELHDKGAGLKSLASYLGMDKIQVEHSGEINLVKYDDDDEKL